MMEISKLIICRQDVIVVSDSDTQSIVTGTNKRKKPKRKTECVRNVKMTKMTVNRIVPNCYRHRCSNAQQHHRHTSKNIKYQGRKASPPPRKYKEHKSTVKGAFYDKDKNDNVSYELSRDLSSPITVASSIEPYENISSCSFQSSESDELEDLIKLTRERMKNQNFNCKFNKSEVNTNQFDYEDISCSEEILDSSIHSMDTIVLDNVGLDNVGENISSATNLEQLHQCHCKEHNNNNRTPLLCTNTTNPILDSNEMLQVKVPSLKNHKIYEDNLSPMYEISGKVLMEHYLNTSSL